MQFKEYQSKVLERLDEYLEVLKTKHQDAKDFVKFQQLKGRQTVMANYCSETWDELNTRRILPLLRDNRGNPQVSPYVNRHDGMGRGIPHICLKVPTAGGKTLLATAAIDRINTDYFERQTGFVLWVVPSDAIYRQTWKNLANREHPYRQMLERASGGRVKMLERHDAFTAKDVEDFLCVMLLMLPAANRKSKETLRMFRDSGNFTSFFPDVDDYSGNNELLHKVKNLEVNDLSDGGSVIKGISIKHSLGNTLRLVRPVVIIDEGHKAYSDGARDTIGGFNPAFILELSATPNSNHHISNILVDVHGTDLKAEQMIKLPINVHNYERSDWKYTLGQAHTKLEELEASSYRLRDSEGRYIRPIMIVRVERTGNDQRDDDNVHAEDAREYLIKHLGVNPDHIKVKSAATDEIGNENLLSEYSQVRYVITKDALKEGWDCPFAYVLTILSKLTATTAITQLVGRVLRQPETRITGVQELNECYIYCFDQMVQDAVQSVRSGLEQEGMGDLGSAIHAVAEGRPVEMQKVTIARSKTHKERQILLPRVLHRDGEGYRPIDYERDILGNLDWDQFGYTETDSFTPDDRDAIETTITRISMAKKDGQWDLPFTQQREDSDTPGEIDHAFLVRQLLEVIPNPWQASRIIDETITALKDRKIDEEHIYTNRLFLMNEMRRNLKEQVLEASEALFRRKLADSEITFKLVAVGGDDINWQLAEELTLNVRDDDRVFHKKNGEPLERHLYERIYSKDVNGLEEDVAWYLDGDQAVQWWHRLVAKQDYNVQGWQKNKIYPDFLACINAVDDGTVKFTVLETKGLHLIGNDDTNYKRTLFDLLENAYNTAVDAGEVEIENQEQRMIFRMLIQDSWRKDLATIINGPGAAE